MTKTHIESLRSEIEAALDKISQFDADCPDRLKEAIRYSLLTPGKRLRPVLVLAACELCGGDRSKAMPAACAVEIIHCYSLIHDDLPAMDNDDLRRGKPTCHKQFNESVAILAGDALIPLAFGCLAKTNSIRCVQELAIAAGASQLVGGQMDDVSGIWTQNGGIKELEHIHHRKTGALIRVSLRLGAILADAAETQIAALDEYGKYFGLTFQITDDLLDVTGDENTAGKRLHKDEGMNKLTYPRLFGVGGANRAAAQAAALAEKSLDCFTEQSEPRTLLLELLQKLIHRQQ
ncbi:geranylgeranyl pyrophosphate synthetase [Planctomycetales bacterium]|nr:geranylgeranyl pyrophosphate synthetase [Planctomycetales bacterium]